MVSVPVQCPPARVPDILPVAYHECPVSVLRFHFAYDVGERQITRMGQCWFCRFHSSSTSQMR